MDRNQDGKIDRFEFIYILLPFEARFKVSLTPTNPATSFILPRESRDYISQKPRRARNHA
jgi:hypothetical protein